MRDNEGVHSCLQPADGEETIPSSMSMDDNVGAREDCKVCGKTWVLAEGYGFVYWRLYR